MSLSAGEFEVFRILIQAADQGVPALKLSQVHERMDQERRDEQRAGPALTTVSSYLRSLLADGHIVECELVANAAPRPVGRANRGLLPTTRSPNTAYTADAKQRSALIRETFEQMAKLYPPDKPKLAVMECAKAVLKLSEEQEAELAALLDKLEPAPVGKKSGRGRG